MFFVVGEGLAVPIGEARLTDEDKGVVIPIALHKIIYAAAVPGFRLIGHHLPDGLSGVRLRHTGDR